MANTPRTICANCRYKLLWVGNTGCWEYACGHDANRLEADEIIDPISGRSNLKPRDIYPLCSDVNDGDCPHYEPRRVSPIGRILRKIGLA